MQELISQIKGKTVDYLNADKDITNGFDIVFTDGTSLELYAVGDKLAWVFNDKKES